MGLNKKRHIFNVLLRVFWLFITLCAFVFFLFRLQWIYALLILPFIIWAITYFIRYIDRIDNEMAEFLEAVHYRDFTRHYVLQKSPVELQPLRNGLNEINSAFRTIMREKETQHQYLRKILELVDTGILSFDAGSGDVIWMNDALKDMLSIPNVKNIDKLKFRNESLFFILQSLKNGESRVISLTRGAGALKVLINMTAFQTEGKIFKLMAFQNVSEALDKSESEAWQKLLNVMTHEIMNSVAPIASLADTLKKRLQQNKEPDSIGFREDLELGIDTIKRRSEGLTKFADTYRNLSKIANIDKTNFLVSNLFETIYQLMYPTLQKKEIELEIVLHHADMNIEADRNLLEQVIINLILNAVEAVKEKSPACITLSATYDNKKKLIAVTDNGKGIAPELMDKIFIPFFSTRKNGNGIGLSLCKQIMLLHDGNIQVYTKKGEGASFRLSFPR